jgi:hypothetical protein
MTRGKEREVDGVRKEKERLTAADHQQITREFGTGVGNQGNSRPTLEIHSDKCSQ